MNKFRYLPFIALIYICGCSSEQAETIADQPVNKQLFEEQIQVIEQAQDVEQVLQDGADRSRQAIEESSQ